MTTSLLLKELSAAGCEPSIDGEDLVLPADPPPHLEALVGILQAPLRGLIEGRKVYAIDAHGRGCRAGGVLNPNELLPRTVRLICVEGRGGWDRISQYATETYPQLFEPAPRAARAA